MNLARKIKRNELRNQFGNKKMKNEHKLWQINKYGLYEYARMQGKTVDDILKEEI